MKNSTHAKWLAGFDMEDLISVILRNGMLVSMGLIGAGLLLWRFGQAHVSFGQNLQAENIPDLLLKAFQQIGSPGRWPALLVHSGIAVLLVTPYLRVIASAVYFGWVEHRWKQALLTGFVLAILTVVLLTDWI